MLSCTLLYNAMGEMLCHAVLHRAIESNAIRSTAVLYPAIILYAVRCYAIALLQCSATSCDALPCDALQFDAKLCKITPSYATQRVATPCYAIHVCVMLRNAMVGYATPCPIRAAMLCYAKLRQPMICIAVLWCTMQWHAIQRHATF